MNEFETQPFEEFKKIPRLFRDCMITEKIDGTNGQILITNPASSFDTQPMVKVEVEGMPYNVYAGSRNRWVTPGKGTDNHGFAAWVAENAKGLVEILGEGRHYGEWWGAGIQRRYGLTGNDKRFSLFHPKWEAVLMERHLAGWGIPQGLGTVPVLYEGKFETKWVEDCLFNLRMFGSQAVPGFMQPEGVVIYHEAAKAYFKATILNDEKPKGSTE